MVNYYCHVQMVTVYSPLTWGIYSNPPPDIPECGFTGELCQSPASGKSRYSLMVDECSNIVMM